MFDLFHRCKLSISVNTKTTHLSHPIGSAVHLINGEYLSLTLILKSSESDERVRKQLYDDLSTSLVVNYEILYRTDLVHKSEKIIPFTHSIIENSLQLQFGTNINITDDSYFNKYITMRISLTRPQNTINSDHDDILSPYNPDRRDLRNFISKSMNTNYHPSIKYTTLKLVITHPVLIYSTYHKIDHNKILLSIKLTNQYLSYPLHVNNIAMKIPHSIDIDPSERELIVDYINQVNDNIEDIILSRMNPQHLTNNTMEDDEVYDYSFFHDDIDGGSHHKLMSSKSYSIADAVHEMHATIPLTRQNEGDTSYILSQDIDHDNDMYKIQTWLKSLSIQLVTPSTSSTVSSSSSSISTSHNGVSKGYISDGMSDGSTVYTCICIHPQESVTWTYLLQNKKNYMCIYDQQVIDKMSSSSLIYSTPIDVYITVSQIQSDISNALDNNPHITNTQENDDMICVRSYCIWSFHN